MAPGVLMRTYSTFNTQDEAIAAALSESEPGEIVEVHTASCGLVEHAETGQLLEPCTCSPMVLRVGAQG